MFNFNTAIDVLTHKLAGQRPTQSHTKINIFFKKNMVDLPTFVGQPIKSAGLIIST